jgi:hypothetical protein
MKRFRIIGVVSGTTLAVGGLWAVCWFHVQPLSRGPQQATFMGFTNGIVGPLAGSYSSQGAHCAAIIQQWFGSGTNAAVFGITNQRSYPVFVYPSVSIESKGSLPTSYQTFTLNAPTLYGIHLHAGQGATVQVATLPGQYPSRARFAFVRDYLHFSAKLTRLPDELRALTKGTPVEFTNEYFYSDWFQQ